MEEREFFEERPEKKPATLNCPHCHQSADYEVTWLVRTKKKQLPRNAAKTYAAARDSISQDCSQWFSLTKSLDSEIDN